MESEVRATNPMVSARMDARINTVLSPLRFRFRVAMENTATSPTILVTLFPRLISLNTSGDTIVTNNTTDTETTPTVKNLSRFTTTLPGYTSYTYNISGA